MDEEEEYVHEYFREWEELGCPECGSLSCQGCAGNDETSS